MTDPTMTTETPKPVEVTIKPCPFCGAPAQVEKVAGCDNTGWLAVCTRKATCASILEETEAEVITAWNTRPEAQSLPTVSGDEGFQAGVDRWMDACFGEPIKSDQLERADRFTEEALELAQTMPGFTKDRAHALVDYVFDRPQGEINQEVGGVMVTLAALCNTTGVNIDAAASTELARVWTKVEQIRAKQAGKPTGSALPSALSPTVSEADGLAGESRIVELPMKAFAHEQPVRDEMRGEQTILTYSDRVATWSLEFFESGWDFPDRWLGGSHWLDISAMWPGVTAQVSALRAQPSNDAEGWRDIASAPKDGTEILACWERCGTRAIVYWSGGPRWLDQSDSPEASNPTHWRPLPTAPGASVQAGGEVEP
jgi:NTP pyrophosphatase (non-canonical NTP hydrolase)